NHDVGTVVLLHECEQGQCDAGDRRCDQQQQPQLDDRLGLEPQCVGHDVGDGFECIRLAMEYVVIRDSSAVQREEECTTDNSHGGSYDHSPTQEISDEELYVLVAPATGAPQRLTHMPPRRPL